MSDTTWRARVQEVIDAVPEGQKLRWTINPGGHWDVGREEGALGFALIDGAVFLACGLDWSWHGDEWKTWEGRVTVVSVGAETLRAMRSWCTNPSAPFPPIPGVPEDYQPKLGQDSAARLEAILDQVEFWQAT